MSNKIKELPDKTEILLQMLSTYELDGFDAAIDFFASKLNDIHKILLCRAILIIPYTNSFFILYEKVFSKNFNYIASNRPSNITDFSSDFYQNAGYPCIKKIPENMLCYFTLHTPKKAVDFYSLRFAIHHSENLIITLSIVIEDPFYLEDKNIHYIQTLLNEFGNVLSNKIDMDTAFLGVVSQKSYLEFLNMNFSLHKVIKQVQQAAKTNVIALVCGETGVGKEYVAKAIHESSNNPKGPFVEVNCGALPESLIDSLLFGHEKGSFTGASNISIGYFEQANGGSIFLDEIGELPIASQVRLLKVLESKKIQRLGSAKTIQLNIKVIAATNRDLKKMVEENKFREDLFYRLNRFIIQIPPLRNRKQDIHSLSSYFIVHKTEEYNLKKRPRLSNNSLDLLYKYSFPGNIRELESIIDSAFIKCIGMPSDELELEININNQILNNKQTNNSIKDSSSLLNTSLEEVLQDHVTRVLKSCNNKIYGQDGAAKKLDIHPNTLRNYIKKYNLG